MFSFLNRAFRNSQPIGDRVALALFMSAAVLCGGPVAQAASAIQIGAAEIEPPTLVSLAITVPIVAGDDNYNAVASVEYRKQGDLEWKAGLPLLRIRPEFASSNRGESFSGSIFYLTHSTIYEVRLSVEDPDGGGGTETLIVSTSSPAVSGPAKPRVIEVSSTAQFQDALLNAASGDVITLAPGIYNGDFRILRRSGTPSDPIFIRGSDRDSVILRGVSAATFQVYEGSHVVLEDLIIESLQVKRAIHLQDAQNVTIRRTIIRAGEKGIHAVGGVNRNIQIYDNVLEGSNSWPTIDSSTWDDEGISVCGEAMDIFRNTLQGFGDALGLNRFCDLKSRSIDIYNNKVLWSGDDALELDDGERNIRAFENYAINTGTLISIQPNVDRGGPFYAFRNVGINQARRPFKLNDGPSGFYLFHNTAVKTYGIDKWLWTQFNNGSIDNFQLKNNMLTSTSSATTKAIAFEAAARVVDFDYNGYSPDGAFWLGPAGDYRSLQEAQSGGSPYDMNGRILASPIFKTAIQLGQDYTTKVGMVDVSLDPTSNAIDAGTPIAGINDGYRGGAPDLGAWEVGAAVPEYGARIQPDGSGNSNAPEPPTELTAE